MRNGKLRRVAVVAAVVVGVGSLLAGPVGAQAVEPVWTATAVPRTGLHGGDLVNITVGGAPLMGVEAYECPDGWTPDAPDEVFDHSCSPTGRPATVARIDESTMAVGYTAWAGTRTFVSAVGQTVTITCGPGHPCNVGLRIRPVERPPYSYYRYASVSLRFADDTPACPAAPGVPDWLWRWFIRILGRCPLPA
jgi:hypothetical protein